jgi:hypothetical protein
MRYPFIKLYGNLHTKPLQPLSYILLGRQDAQKLSDHYIPSHFSKSISKQITQASIGVQAGVRQALAHHTSKQTPKLLAK